MLPNPVESSGDHCHTELQRNTLTQFQGFDSISCLSEDVQNSHYNGLQMDLNSQ